MVPVRSLLLVIVVGALALAAGCQDGSSPLLPAARAAPGPGEPLFAAVAEEVTAAPTTADTAEVRHRTLRRLARLLLTTDGASLVDGALAPADASQLEELLTTDREQDAAPLLDERLRRLCEAGARSTVRDVRRVSFRGRDGGRRAGLLFVPRRPAAAAPWCEATAAGSRRSPGPTWPASCRGRARTCWRSTSRARARARA